MAMPIDPCCSRSILVQYLHAWHAAQNAVIIVNDADTQQQESTATQQQPDRAHPDAADHPQDQIQLPTNLTDLPGQGSPFNTDIDEDEHEVVTVVDADAAEADAADADADADHGSSTNLEDGQGLFYEGSDFAPQQNDSDATQRILAFRLHVVILCMYVAGDSKLMCSTSLFSLFYTQHARIFAILATLTEPIDA